MIGTVLDIETTGYLEFEVVNGKSQLKDTCEILEVGYININLDTGKLIKYGTLYFYKPYFYVESKAQEIHGLTRDFLKQYEDDFEKNLCILNTLMQKTVIIGKNSHGFDIPFIEAFINKHSGGILDFEALSINLGQKTYSGGKLFYSKDCLSWDMQGEFKEHFHRLYAEAYGIKVGLNVSEEEVRNKLDANPNISADDYRKCMELHQSSINNVRVSWYYPDKEHPAIAKTKKGTLSEYIDVIPNGHLIVNKIYGDMEKVRCTGAHGALYDCVATYVVWYFCKTLQQ